MQASGPLLLLILDGWGMREPAPDNAIAQARTPNWDTLLRSCPHALLETSGEAVGLPAGQMGNSEVGHMNIGAGRVVHQELTRIDCAIADGEFQDNPALLETIDAADAGTVHIMGLLSAGGVHSHEDHFLATIELAAARHRGAIAVHVFLDGRDTPPRSARASLEKLQACIDRHPNARIASISGRYWAMDRDQRWERVHRAWLALAHARAEFSARDALEALAAAYARDENDEFIQPTQVGRGAPIADGDSAIFINFRADRARQLTRVLVDPSFDRFPERRPRLARMASMTRYENDLDVAVAFPPTDLPDLLGQVLARAGLRQLRIAETEKYAHVTYFFNGGREQLFEGEDRKLIASPRVATYDLQPEMSAPELARELVAAIRSGNWPVIIGNVANPDMVGHSGIFEAAVRAVEAVDALLGQVIEAIDQSGGQLIVTADHGNVEQMSDPETGQAHTAHTLNPVPLVYRGRNARVEARGSLRDIAPTMLNLLGLNIPEAMTGRPLIHLDTAGGARATAADGTHP
ncbi:MAG: 2,3-bisphosphoglycerate-independent phosphoglycerate mutase [Gammaproteobacteria bacterium HGW-Gammaproteobacteria-8]|nr:MAG: 2,3-bisphosphoglycerate-independent phosphoglycerate mutase [Gammaproteobacteria bacterium HGW-Gammaproteobacteria-8]